LAAINAAIEATEKMQRLMKLVCAAIPQWHSSRLTGAVMRRSWRADA